MRGLCAYICRTLHAACCTFALLRDGCCTLCVACYTSRYIECAAVELQSRPLAHVARRIDRVVSPVCYATICAISRGCRSNAASLSRRVLNCYAELRKPCKPSETSAPQLRAHCLLAGVLCREPISDEKLDMMTELTIYRRVRTHSSRISATASGWAGPWPRAAVIADGDARMLVTAGRAQRCRSDPTPSDASCRFGRVVAFCVCVWSLVGWFVCLVLGRFVMDSSVVLVLTVCVARLIRLFNWGFRANFRSGWLTFSTTWSAKT